MLFAVEFELVLGGVLDWGLPIATDFEERNKFLFSKAFALSNPRVCVLLAPLTKKTVRIS